MGFSAVLLEYLQGGFIDLLDTLKPSTPVKSAVFQENKDGWAVLPKRWVVERTFSWLGHFRRLSKDAEILTATSENIIHIAMLKITLAKCV